MTAKLQGVQLAYKSVAAADREFFRGKAYWIINLSLALFVSGVRCCIFRAAP
jgi:hypothetical protein